MTQTFGWIPPSWRTPRQLAVDDRVRQKGIIRPFAYTGKIPDAKDRERYGLWEIITVVAPNFAPNWQIIGSCVGAAWGTVCNIRGAVDILTGDLESYSPVFWPWTWGQSRTRAGLYGPGDGSFGSAMAESAVEDGLMYTLNAPQSVPKFSLRSGWPVLSEAIERQFSDGRAMAVEPYRSAAKRHPFKAVIEIKSIEEAEACLIGAMRPITVASMFGTRTITPQGSPSVNIARYDDRWPHQMYIDGRWIHPTLGGLWRWGNNWGPKAHPAPVDSSPEGGFWITDATFDKILRTSDTEAFAFGDMEGIKETTLSWGRI